MIRFTYEGKEFEFKGKYRDPLDGDHFLSGTGKSIDSSVVYQSGRWQGMGQRAIVHPVLVIHEFGGVKFVEIGETRPAQMGEWFLINSGPTFRKPNYSTSGSFIILTPYEENN